MGFSKKRSGSRLSLGIFLVMFCVKCRHSDRAEEVGVC